MLFSIIVVALNPGDKLGQTVESILSQTYTDYEIVVKDGGSKDDSLQQLPENERIKVFVEKDTGIYEAMNQAVEKACGRYILFLNCGDTFYDNGVLERAAACIMQEEGKEPLIVYGDTYGAKNNVVIGAPGKIDGFACFRNIPCHQSCFYEAKLCKNKPYRPEYRIRADYDHFLWCYYRAKARMVHMGSIVASYEGGGYSESKENRKRDKEEHRLITEEYIEARELAKYRRTMLLTLAPLRSLIAENKWTSRLYHQLKRGIYKAYNAIGLIGKLILLWVMALGGMLLLSYYRTGESFSMVWIDLASGFIDCPEVWQYFAKIMPAVSALFVFLIVLVLVLERLKPEVRILNKKLDITPQARWIHYLFNIGLCIAGVLTAYAFSLSIKPSLKGMFRADWEGDELIAHACGGIDNTDYTNSLEAFELSYAQGIRSIEVDFSLTADGKLVCCHDWDRSYSSAYGEGHVYTEEEFLNIKIYDKYTPISVDDLFALMKEYDDVWIITDTKESTWEAVQTVFGLLVERAEATDSMEELDRFVVQLYNLEMYDAVEAVYSFPSYILTLYQMGQPRTEDMIAIGRFCRQRGIETVTMSHYWPREDLMEVAARYDLDIYVHTVNDMNKVAEMEAWGVKGYYTDYLTPDMMAQSN